MTATLIGGKPCTSAPDASTVAASVPKYTATIEPMNTHSTRMNLPCVVRYVLHVS